jgi:hypothetical protein
MCLSFGSSLVDNLNNLSLDLGSHHILLSLYLSNKDCAYLLSFDYRDLLSGLSSHFRLILLNFCPINRSLDIHHLSIVYTFHICHLLRLFIFYMQLLVTIFLDMILQRILKFCFFLKSLS